MTSSRRNLRRAPIAFTEHGAIMLASVLNSDRAVEMSIFVVRALTQMREMLMSNHQLASKLDELENHVADHDEGIAELFAAIRRLLNPPEQPRREIGFHIREAAPLYRIRPKKRF